MRVRDACLHYNRLSWPHLPLIDLMHSLPAFRCGLECYAVHCLKKKTHTHTNNKLFFFFSNGKLAVANGSSPLVVMSHKMTRRVSEEG